MTHWLFGAAGGAKYTHGSVYPIEYDTPDNGVRLKRCARSRKITVREPGRSWPMGDPPVLPPIASTPAQCENLAALEVRLSDDRRSGLQARA
jgi:hypothetical protein